jgi:hypothetical protein
MITKLVRLAGAAFAATVLAFSGLYVVVYLARWEWNRAIVSGIIFLAMLVMLSTFMILGRLRALLERPAGPVAAGPVDPQVLDALHRSNEGQSAHRFDWLRPDPTRLSVFVPVLLGTGMVLSALAYVIERVAGAVAGATLDRRTAGVLPLHLPLSNAGPVSAVNRPRAGSRSGRPTRALWRVAGGLIVLLAIAAGVDGLRGITQSRLSELSFPGTTEIVLEVRTRGGSELGASVDELWAVCNDRIPGGLRLVSALAGAEGTVTLLADRALGDTGRRRVVGCLEDLTVDQALADVVSLTVRRRG